VDTTAKAVPELQDVFGNDEESEYSISYPVIELFVPADAPDQDSVSVVPDLAMLPVDEVAGVKDEGADAAVDAIVWYAPK
jgi:hypothetical protein